MQQIKILQFFLANHWNTIQSLTFSIWCVWLSICKLMCSSRSLPGVLYLINQIIVSGIQKAPLKEEATVAGLAICRQVKETEVIGNRMFKGGSEHLLSISKTGGHELITCLYFLQHTEMTGTQLITKYKKKLSKCSSNWRMLYTTSLH